MAARVTGSDVTVIACLLLLILAGCSGSVTCVCNDNGTVHSISLATFNYKPGVPLDDLFSLCKGTCEAK